MRSTQFDDPIDEASAEQHGRHQHESLCERLKRIGYARNKQVRFYGEVFDLLSDPVRVGDNLVFVDAVDRKSGQFRRVRIPRTIIHMVRMDSRAA